MLKSFYLTNTTFYLLGLAVILFCFGLLTPACFLAGLVLILSILLALIIESLILFRDKNPVEFQRKLPVRLSNGDENRIYIEMKNNLSRPVHIILIENLPFQFQIFDFEKNVYIKSGQKLSSFYPLTPVHRGIYTWGPAVILCKLKKWSLVMRKQEMSDSESVDCYPSFLQFPKIELQTRTENTQHNETLTPKIGQSLEFEQIKEYTSGDDYRHINWKASAKRGHLMLNQYRDERSQDIYCVIDTGRTMKMPFHKQTLLDYAINASLALSRAVISAKDKAGIIAFGYDTSQSLSPKKDWSQIAKINELLFNLNTDFLESDFEYLYKFVRVSIKRRSMLVLFTNFDSENSLHRNLKYLKDIARHHLLIVVFFENAEISDFLTEEATDLKTIYEKTIGFDHIQKKQLIVKELRNAGIRTVLSRPEKLSPQVVKKYAEIKKQQIL